MAMGMVVAAVAEDWAAEVMVAMGMVVAAVAEDWAAEVMVVMGMVVAAVAEDWAAEVMVVMGLEVQVTVAMTKVVEGWEGLGLVVAAAVALLGSPVLPA